MADEDVKVNTQATPARGKKNRKENKEKQRIGEKLELAEGEMTNLKK